MFAEPVEDETGPQTLAEVVASLIAAHDQQLLAHARRVLHMAELTGDIPAGAIDARDSVNEVVRICLAALEKKPSDLTYEEWFYRLVVEETGRQIREFTEETRLRVSPIGETSRSQTPVATAKAATTETLSSGFDFDFFFITSKAPIPYSPCGSGDETPFRRIRQAVLSGLKIPSIDQNQKCILSRCRWE